MFVFLCFNRITRAQDVNRGLLRSCWRRGGVYRCNINLYYIGSATFWQIIADTKDEHCKIEFYTNNFEALQKLTLTQSVTPSHNQQRFHTVIHIIMAL